MGVFLYYSFKKNDHWSPRFPVTRVHRLLNNGWLGQLRKTWLKLWNSFFGDWFVICFTGVGMNSPLLNLLLVLKHVPTLRNLMQKWVTIVYIYISLLVLPYRIIINGCLDETAESWSLSGIEWQWKEEEKKQSCLFVFAGRRASDMGISSCNIEPRARLRIWNRRFWRTR